MNTSAFPSVKQALQTVMWGAISAQQATEALFAGLCASDRARFRVLSEGKPVDPHCLYLWDGHIPGVVGRYWIPQPLDGHVVQRAVNTYGSGVQGFHSGLGDPAVYRLCSNPMEADDQSLSEQADRLDWLQETAGISFSLVLLSGDHRQESLALTGLAAGCVVKGKSIHAHYASSEPIDPRDQTQRAVWEDIQTHLIAIMRSDPAIQEAPRLMRMPSFLGTEHGKPAPVRVQTTLIAKYAGVRPADLLAALQRVAVVDGITSVPVAVAALRTAKRWLKDAKDAEIGAEGWDEINDIVARTRQNRAVDPKDEALVRLILPDKSVGKGGSSSGIRIGKTERRTLPPDFVVNHPGGSVRLDAVKEHIRCQCPEHGGASGSSAFAESKDGLTYLCCPACRITWNLEIPNPFSLVIPVAPAAPLVPAVPTRIQVINERWLPTPKLTTKVTYIKSAQNTGKTFSLRPIALAADSVLALSHRVSLIEKLCVDWNLKNYRDWKGLDEIKEKRLGICANSAYKLQNPNGGMTAAQVAGAQIDAILDGLEGFHVLTLSEGYKLVIIDESEQFVRHLFGDTIKGKLVRVYTSIEHALRTADQIVCLDADLSLLTIRAIRRLMGWKIDHDEMLPDESAVINEFKVTDRSCLLYRESADLTAKIDELWADGKRLWIACDSKRLAEVLAHRLQEAAPTKRVLCISHDTKDDDAPIALFTDPDVESKNWDAIVVSPAVATGLSVEIKDHWDAICLYLGGGSVIAADGVQMAYRVRNPVDTCIYAWATKRIERCATDSNTIKKDKELVNKRGEDLILVEKVIDAIPVKVPKDPDIFDAWADVVSYDRHGRNRIRGAFLRVCEQRGVKVDEAPELDDETRKLIGRATRETREKIDRAYAQSVVSAKVLTDVEYAEQDGTQKWTRADTLSHRRYEICRWYGIDPVGLTDELVLEDNGGKLRGRLSRFVSLELLQEGLWEPLGAHDAASLRQGIRARQTQWAVGAKLLAGLLRLHGIGNPSYTGQVHPPTTGQMIVLCQESTLLQGLTGVQVPLPKGWSEKPMRYLGSLLHSAGLKLWSAQRLGASGAKRTRAYTLDPGTVAVAQERTRRRKQWIIDHAKDLIAGRRPLDHLPAAPVQPAPIDPVEAAVRATLDRLANAL